MEVVCLITSMTINLKIDIMFCSLLFHYVNKVHLNQFHWIVISYAGYFINGDMFLMLVLGKICLD